MFHQVTLPSKFASFQELKDSVRLEHLGKGRSVAILTDANNVEKVPLVRTTSIYHCAAQCFSPIHYLLKNMIVKAFPEADGVQFNHAMFEHYTTDYRTMGFHSDQMLDLQEDSWIAIYSCYSNENPAMRKLVVQSKLDKHTTFELMMEPNSIILFSTRTNAAHVHKIVLVDHEDCSDTEWIGVTFRMSKTLARYDEKGETYMKGDKLKLASEDEKKLFFKLKGQENATVTTGTSKDLDFTLSPSDLMVPIGL